ncbi:MAG: molybdate ABC transporter substrate-binding protein [Opitutaceae bacterium]|nr:molybdate ABC transporter substrate-binding protein [Opitutaceae bacterium]
MILRQLLLSLGIVLGLQAAEPLRVAAAANLVHVMPDLVAAFHETHPDIRVETSFGASGSLVAQIKHGAPYAVFLSADLDYPQALITAGEASEANLVIFAIGQLVLWSRHDAMDMSDLATTLRAPSLRKIAIANPATAPYGRAAQQTLEQLGLWTPLHPKLVVAENISQTVQFTDSGNADVGFIALSSLKSPALAGRGAWQTVPASLHAPMVQGAILTKRGAADPAARVFMEFLRSPAARNVFARYGYDVPVSP